MEMTTHSQEVPKAAAASCTLRYLLGLPVQNARFQCVSDNLSTGMQAKLLSNPRPIGLNRFSAYVQTSGDLGQSVSVGKHFQYLLFALAEYFGAGFCLPGK